MWEQKNWVSRSRKEVEEAFGAGNEKFLPTNFFNTFA